MKCIILVPTEVYKDNAGARIRYRRLEPQLAELEIELELIDIAAFDPAKNRCDFLVVSKCYDARATILAAAAAEYGTRIGLDLFDDYFSQRSDPRLQRLRSWLSGFLAIADFALCSTEAMARTISAYRQDLPVHVIDDPAPPLDHERLARRLASKLARARFDRTFKLAWFGIGDNPHFKVGLSDLAASAAELARLADHGLDVELTVLTNARALKWASLAEIAGLPLKVRVEEWSEEGEQSLLDEAFACILPVNAQAFSTAKSLNRAVTALACGCQVLSLGYPLYEPLDAFIYRSPEQLIADLDKGEMRLDGNNLAALDEQLEVVAGARKEAARLFDFLHRTGSTPSRQGSRQPLFVIHGLGTLETVHKLQQLRGGLSVASPFCLAELNFDVRFRLNPEQGLTMLVAERARKWLHREAQAAFPWSEYSGRSRMWSDRPRPDPSGGSASRVPPPGLAVALAPGLLQQMRLQLEAAFGSGLIVVSETSNLPIDWTGQRA